MHILETQALSCSALGMVHEMVAPSLGRECLAEVGQTPMARGTVVRPRELRAGVQQAEVLQSCQDSCHTGRRSGSVGVAESVSDPRLGKTSEGRPAAGELRQGPECRAPGEAMSLCGQQGGGGQSGCSDLAQSISS